MDKFLRVMIVRVWREEAKMLSTKERRLHKDIEQFTSRKNKIVEMLVNGEITPEEKKILISKINDEAEKAQKQLNDLGSMSELKANSIDYALEFMSNAPRIWNDASVEHRIIYQNLVFPEGLSYDLATNQFGTPKLSALYTLAGIKKDPSIADESLVVTSRRIELRLPG